MDKNTTLSYEALLFAQILSKEIDNDIILEVGYTTFKSKIQKFIDLFYDYDNDTNSSLSYRINKYCELRGTLILTTLYDN